MTKRKDVMEDMALVAAESNLVWGEMRDAQVKFFNNTEDNSTKMTEALERIANSLEFLTEMLCNRPL